MADDTQTTDTTETATEQDESTESTAQIGDAGKEAIRKERERARAAEKRAKDAETRLAEIDAEQKRRDEETAREQGKFEDLATKRAQDLDKATSTITTLTEERDALSAKVQAYEDRDRAAIAAGVKDLPDDLKAFDPGDDAPLEARMTWFTKAREIAGKRTTTAPRGNGRNPDEANGRNPKAEDEARRLFATQNKREF